MKKEFKKISDFKDEEAIEVLADLIDPVSEIMGDEETAKFIKDHYKEKGERLKIVSMILKKHKHEVFEILAAMEQVPVEKYHCNVMTLPMQILSILNDEEFMRIFFSQEEPDSENSSGSVTENTKWEKGK